MNSEEFTGHVRAMRADNEFFGAEDFLGLGDVPAQVVKCNRCLKRKACGKTVDEMYTLNLNINGRLARKELWIKATNRQQITKLYGPNVGDWKGKWIWVYVTECNSPTGGKTFGIRLRDKKDAPTTSQHKSPKPDTTDLSQQNDPAQAYRHEIGQCVTGEQFRQLIESIEANTNLDAETRAELVRETVERRDQ